MADLQIAFKLIDWLI